MAEELPEAIRPGPRRRWVAEADCCAACNLLDGKVRRADKHFGRTATGEAIYRPPLHQHCKCKLEQMDEVDESLSPAREIIRPGPFRRFVRWLLEGDKKQSRGQPDNAGKFGPGGYGKKHDSAKKADKPAAADKKPAGNKERPFDDRADREVKKVASDKASAAVAAHYNERVTANPLSSKERQRFYQEHVAGNKAILPEKGFEYATAMMLGGTQTGESNQNAIDAHIGKLAMANGSTIAAVAETKSTYSDRNSVTFANSHLAVVRKWKQWKKEGKPFAVTFAWKYGGDENSRGLYIQAGLHRTATVQLRGEGNRQIFIPIPELADHRTLQDPKLWGKIEAKVQQAVSQLDPKKTVAEMNKDYKSVLAKEVAETFKGMDEEDTKVGVKAVVDQVGVKAVVDQVGVKAVVDQVGVKDLAASLSDEQKTALLAELTGKKK